MDVEKPDLTPLKPEALGITKERWNQLIAMLSENGYIQGVKIKNYLGEGIVVSLDDVRITLRGLEYLEENTMMKKAVSVVKDIRDILPV